MTADSPPMKAASALSQHPLATHAVGEVAGSILDALGDQIDLLVVFVERTHTGAVEDIASALRELLRPEVLVGTTACGVLCDAVEVEDQPALAVWAATGVTAHPVRLARDPISEELPIPVVLGSDLVLLADPFTMPINPLLEGLAQHAPGLSIHGGLASAANAPGGNRLLLNGDVFDNGAVGVFLDHEHTASVVAQGCRPIGEPLVVTETAGPRGGGAHILTRVASKPPLEVLQKLASELDENDRELLSNGVHIGVVIDETIHDFTRGDFLIRGVTGADPGKGALAIGAEVDVGTTVQFQVRDAQTASEDLRQMLQGNAARAALTFTCNGRGKHLFGRPGHDAELVHGLTGSTATAGMFCAGEFGPVGTQNHVHGFTASTLLFE